MRLKNAPGSRTDPAPVADRIVPMQNVAATLRHDHGRTSIRLLRDIFGPGFAPGAPDAGTLAAYLDQLDPPAVARFVEDWNNSDDAPPVTAAEAEEAELYSGGTFVRRGRGRPPTGNAKELVSLRLDRDVLAKLREAGPGWQSTVNARLRDSLGLGNARPQPTTPHALRRGV